MKLNYKSIILAIFALPIILTLSLSKNVGALKYDIKTLPLYVPYNLSSGNIVPGSSDGLSMTVSNDIDPSNYFAQQDILGFSSEDDGTCSYSNYAHLPYYYSSSDDTYFVSYNYYGFYGYLPSTWTFNNDPCFDVSRSDFTDAGMPSGLFNNFLRDNLPYRQKWSGLYLSDSHKDEEKGLDYSTKFDLSDIFGMVDNGDYPNKIYELWIPFGVPSEDQLSNFYADMPIKFSGEIVIDFDSPPSSVIGLTDNTDISLLTSYIYNGSDRSYSDEVSCTYSLGLEVPGDYSSVRTLNYTCNTSISSYYVSGEDLPYFQLYFNFDYDTQNTKFYQFIFDSSFSITDNDDTYGGSWGDEIVGSDTSSAPGSATQFIWNDIEQDGVNWSSSLTSLFDFSFINPFAPIFDLFTNSNSCAQIPIIAGMIHSNETQVCPWFDSNVRSITTPVLGIFSMMLIFGFAVRWLGASSGNMFEDSGHIESPGYSSTGGTAIRHGWRRK